MSDTSSKIKALGDEKYRRGDTTGAIQAYSRAICAVQGEWIVSGTKDDTELLYKLYCNRSAAYLQLGNAENALEDANSSILLDDAQAKGFARRGSALCTLQDYSSASECYQAALLKFPNAEILQQGLEKVRNEQQKEASRRAPRGNQNDAKPRDVLPDNDSPRANPGLWKLAGRSIRKNSLGKFTLDGIKNATTAIQKTAKATQKSLMPSGEIYLEYEDDLKVYKVHDKIKGKVHLKLPEPRMAQALTVALRASRMCRSLDSSVADTEEDVFHDEYEIDGKRMYESDESVPFEVMVPKVVEASSNNPVSMVLNGVIDAASGVSTVGMPILWTMYATLCDGSILPLSSKEHRLHVDDGAV